jgi:hypothetical protein
MYRKVSTAVRRIKRFRRKWVTEALVKRAKKLLPVMYPHLRIDLINWDYLEYLLFPIYDELGIPTELRPFYTAWAKRKAELGLKFSEATQLEEYTILMTEFETRGLDTAFLEALELYVDDWVSQMKGQGSTIFKFLPTGVLWNNGFWTEVGSSPYLNLDDGDANKIVTVNDWGDIGLTCEDTSKTQAPSKIIWGCKFKKVGTGDCFLIAQIRSLSNFYYVFNQWFSAVDYTLVERENDIYGVPLATRLNTQAKINDAVFRFMQIDGYPSLTHITYAYLKVFY